MRVFAFICRECGASYDLPDNTGGDCPKCGGRLRRLWRVANTFHPTRGS